jgi:hypothetical protein
MRVTASRQGHTKRARVTGTVRRLSGEIVGEAVQGTCLIEAETFTPAYRHSSCGSSVTGCD